MPSSSSTQFSPSRVDDTAFPPLPTSSPVAQASEPRVETQAKPQYAPPSPKGTVAFQAQLERQGVVIPISDLSVPKGPWNEDRAAEERYYARMHQEFQNYKNAEQKIKAAIGIDVPAYVEGAEALAHQPAQQMHSLEVQRMFADLDHARRELNSLYQAMREKDFVIADMEALLESNAFSKSRAEFISHSARDQKNRLIKALGTELATAKNDRSNDAEKASLQAKELQRKIEVLEARNKTLQEELTSVRELLVKYEPSLNAAEERANSADSRVEAAKQGQALAQKEQQKTGKKLGKAQADFDVKMAAKERQVKSLQKLADDANAAAAKAKVKVAEVEASRKNDQATIKSMQRQLNEHGIVALVNTLEESEATKAVREELSATIKDLQVKAGVAEANAMSHFNDRNALDGEMAFVKVLIARLVSFLERTDYEAQNALKARQGQSLVDVPSSQERLDALTDEVRRFVEVLVRRTQEFRLPSQSGRPRVLVIDNRTNTNTPGVMSVQQAEPRLTSVPEQDPNLVSDTEALKGLANLARIN